MTLLRRILNLFTTQLTKADRAALTLHRNIWLGKQRPVTATAGRPYSF